MAMPPSAAQLEMIATGRKPCSMCGQIKARPDFYAKAAKTDGLRPDCKECCKAAANGWNRANPERMRARIAEYRKVNSARVAEANRRRCNLRYLRVRESLIAERAARRALRPPRSPMPPWRHRNRERAALAAKRWYLLNKDRQRVRAAEWARANPERIRAKTVRYHHRKAGRDTGNVTGEWWIGQKAYFGGRCAYCLGEFSSLEMEHMQPVSRGGMHDKDNIVPACRSCNAHKSSKTLLELLAA